MTTAASGGGVTSPAADARGFTLLEVLVALALLALVMAALVQAVAAQAGQLREARLRTEAQWVASNVLAQARLAPAALPAGPREGRMEMGQRQWTWRREIVPTGTPGVTHLRIAVFAPDDGRQMLALDGFVAAP